VAVAVRGVGRPAAAALVSAEQLTPPRTGGARWQRAAAAAAIVAGARRWADGAQLQCLCYRWPRGWARAGGRGAGRACFWTDHLRQLALALPLLLRGRPRAASPCPARL